MNTNEAILNKLIELRYVETKGGMYKDADAMFSLRRQFDPLKNGSDSELIKSALFDVCGKRDYVIRILDNQLRIGKHDKTVIFYGFDTSRESFVAAFEKVVGI